jgi:hypothetical protein
MRVLFAEIDSGENAQRSNLAGHASHATRFTHHTSHVICRERRLVTTVGTMQWRAARGRQNLMYARCYRCIACYSPSRATLRMPTKRRTSSNVLYLRKYQRLMAVIV